MSAAQQIIIKPQPGPQTEFLQCAADIAIYGGAAGSGKSYALLLDPLYNAHNPEFGTVIFRRNSTQVRNQGGLWHESTKLYTQLGAHPREAFLEWVFKSGMKVKFGHLEYEKTVYDWQGSQIPLICCELNTKILMENNQFKLIKDISIGDSIKNMSENKRVTKIGKPRLEECVLVKYGKNYEQIHSYNHEILTTRGWVSYEAVHKAFLSDSAEDQIPKRLNFFLKYDEYFHGKYQEFLQLYDSLLKDLKLKLLIYQSKSDRLICKDSFVYTASLNLENSYELFRNKHLKISPHILNYLFLKLRSLFQKIKGDIFSVDLNLDEFFDARILLKFEDYLNHYFLCFHPYDEQLGLSLETSLDGALLLNDVVRYIHIDQILDEEGKVQKYNRFPDNFLLYVHPYTDALIRETTNDLFLDSIGMIPVGKKWVIDITIEDSNYYITENGLINKNCYDELTHFTFSQFFYMLSRNRSMSGVPGRMRATTNPDAKSWVRLFIDWWIDNNTGLAIRERSGKVRYFIRDGDSLIWADTKAELVKRFGPEVMPKSVTFINASIYDNKILLEKDPGYLANLKSLSRVERERLLGGNWNICATAGLIFQREWFPIVEAIPSGWVDTMRFWDRAATKKTEENDPDWTRGLKMYKYADGSYVVGDLRSARDSPGQISNLIKNVAGHDGHRTRIMSQQDPGSAGVMEADHFIRSLAGYNVRVMTTSKDKLTRAMPVSAQAEAGNIKVLKAPWNEEFFAELENFPDGAHDDCVDVLSGAFNELAVGASMLDVYQNLRL